MKEEKNMKQLLISTKIKLSQLSKKKKLIIIGAALAVIISVICIICAVQNAGYRKITGRYVNPETGDSIKVTYDDDVFCLSGLTDYSGDTLPYYCYPKGMKENFRDYGDYVRMIFEPCDLYYDPIDCKYIDDGVEEQFILWCYDYCNDYEETYIKE